LYFVRRYDDAIEQARRALELDPGFASARADLGLAYEAKGMHREALAELGKLPPNGLRDVLLGYTYARSGDRARAVRILDKLEARAKNEGGGAANIAIVCVGLGDKDRTFVWLNKSLDERDWI